MTLLNKLESRAWKEAIGTQKIIGILLDTLGTTPPIGLLKKTKK